MHPGIEDPKMSQSIQ